VVFVGRPPDKEYCYKIETIRPNLELSESVHIVGRITDGHDAPLKKSRVELRKYISQRKQVTVKATTTDEKGYFDLGTVAAGKYRLLASPHRGFQQPADLKCPSGNKCELNIALQVNPTDLPVSACPIR
jgi:carboxypeptidase family protein